MESDSESKPVAPWIPVVAILIIVVVLIGGAEAAVRIAYRRTMDFDMEMWKYATLIKRKSESPKISHEHRPGTSAFLMGSEVNINSQGLRDREYSIEKPSNTYRILMLGDSMTFGWGAKVEDTFSKKLERDLNQRGLGIRFEVINTGVGNYNTSQEVEYFRERGVAYKPDLVILCYFINDAEVTQTPNLGWLQEHSYLYALTWSRIRIVKEQMKIRMSSEEYYKSLYLDSNPGWAVAKRALRDFPEIARSIQAKPLLVVIPELKKLKKEIHPFLPVYDQVSEEVRQGGGDVFPLFPAFEAAGVKDESTLWVCPTDAHPSELAHRIMAEAIASYLTRPGNGVLLPVLNSSQTSLQSAP